MAVTAPVIDLLPDPPLPTDPESVFDIKSGASLTAQQLMVPQLNISLSWVATQVNAAESYKNAAATSAGAAADSAAAANSSKNAAAQSAIDATNNGAEQVALAAAQANKAAVQASNAAASATAAESAQGSIGNLALMHSVALSF
ncbi:hypothetical protein SAMN05216205_1188 [Pseudomonas mohnii]|uniref:Uncharacterized protein n=1 Tax=Pseudomonas mohnii TaxID=395600 RepID=A0ABY0XRQ5_9PSED|nr:hypothetical protein [Pseudomonas mohnii]SEB99556.1 hypothetical protein SAMN05216205_1188 [Pseudomonas mohnii]